MSQYQIGRISGPRVKLYATKKRRGIPACLTHDLSSLAKSIAMDRDKEFRAGSNERSRTSSSDSTVTSTCSQHSADNTFAVQRALDDDLKHYPSIDRETQQKIVKKYRDLHSRVKTDRRILQLSLREICARDASICDHLCRLFPLLKKRMLHGLCRLAWSILGVSTLRRRQG